MEKKLTELKSRLMEINDLQMATALLNWDQSTYMPPGAAAARGRQMATLGKLAHEKFTSAEVGKLLDALRPYAETLPYDHDDAALLRRTQTDFDQATKIPSELLSEMMAHSAAAYQTWT
ncbi:MAG: carboxypeptidase M32, partial [Anaerolineae bacterium]